MRTKILLGMMVLGMIWVGGVARANEDMPSAATASPKMPPAKPGSAEFEKIKSLAGPWRGAAAMRAPGNCLSKGR